MRKNNRFSNAQRLEILDVYLHSSSSKRAIEKEYGLSCGLIRYWLSIFALEDKAKECMSITEAHLNESSPSVLVEDVASLKIRIKQLESSLKEAEMARDAYSCMIDLAEDKYHISVRKNSAAK